MKGTWEYLPVLLKAMGIQKLVDHILKTLEDKTFNGKFDGFD